jgi:hypothetical protein
MCRRSGGDTGALEPPDLYRVKGARKATPLCDATRDACFHRFIESLPGVDIRPRRNAQEPIVKSAEPELLLSSIRTPDYRQDSLAQCLAWIPARDQAMQRSCPFIMTLHPEFISRLWSESEIPSCTPTRHHTVCLPPIQSVQTRSGTRSRVAHQSIDSTTD